MKHISPVLNEYREILEQEEFEQLVKDLIDSFFEVSPKQLDQLKISYNIRDDEAFKRAAHTLKSSGDTFGFTEFRSMASELETRGCINDFALIKQLVTRLEIEYAKVKTNLQALQDSM